VSEWVSEWVGVVSCAVWVGCARWAGWAVWEVWVGSVGTQRAFDRLIYQSFIYKKKFCVKRKGHIAQPKRSRPQPGYFVVKTTLESRVPFFSFFFGSMIFFKTFSKLFYYFFCHFCCPRDSIRAS
jgi:hypothetical protein